MNDTDNPLYPTKLDAAMALCPNGQGYTVGGGPVQWVDLGGHSEPSTSAIDAKLAELITQWNNKKYERDRTGETHDVKEDTYPGYGEQLDALYRDILAGKVDSTGEFATRIKKTKDKYPKP